MTDDDDHTLNTEIKYNRCIHSVSVGTVGSISWRKFLSKIKQQVVRRSCWRLFVRISSKLCVYIQHHWLALNELVHWLVIELAIQTIHSSCRPTYNIEMKKNTEYTYTPTPTRTSRRRPRILVRLAIAHLCVSMFVCRIVKNNQQAKHSLLFYALSFAWLTRLFFSLSSLGLYHSIGHHLAPARGSLMKGKWDVLFVITSLLNNHLPLANSFRLLNLFLTTHIWLNVISNFWSNWLCY